MFAQRAQDRRRHRVEAVSGRAHCPRSTCETENWKQIVGPDRHEVDSFEQIVEFDREGPATSIIDPTSMRFRQAYGHADADKFQLAFRSSDFGLIEFPALPTNHWEHNAQ